MESETSNNVQENSEESTTQNWLALPETVQGLINQRKMPSRATLHDRVEQVYLKCYEDEKFRALRMPVYREQTVEGNFIDDDVAAAQMIRDQAKRMGDLMVAREKLSVLRKSLNVVERRYNAHRSQRVRN